MKNFLYKGDIHIHPNFLSDDIYKDVLKKLNKLKWNETYQPNGGVLTKNNSSSYGNRYQACPTYEYLFKYHQNYIQEKFEKLLGEKIIEYKCIARKIITEELKKSQCKGRYGFIHRDIEDKYLNAPVFAAVMYFDQSFDGGTAFFENRWEQVPDITIGAYPNRLILYYGGRWHAPAFDHTYKERKTLSFFLRLAN